MPAGQAGGRPSRSCCLLLSWILGCLRRGQDGQGSVNFPIRVYMGNVWETPSSSSISAFSLVRTDSRNSGRGGRRVRSSITAWPSGHGFRSTCRCQAPSVTRRTRRTCAVTPGSCRSSRRLGLLPSRSVGGYSLGKVWGPFSASVAAIGWRASVAVAVVG